MPAGLNYRYFPTQPYLVEPLEALLVCSADAIRIEWGVRACISSAWSTSLSVGGQLAGLTLVVTVHVLADEFIHSGQTCLSVLYFVSAFDRCSR
jgi:hypothetical protein